MYFLLSLLCFQTFIASRTLLSRAHPLGPDYEATSAVPGPQFPLCLGSVFPQGLQSIIGSQCVYATHRATQWVSRRNLGPPSI